MTIEVVANSRSRSAVYILVCSNSKLQVPPSIAIGVGDKAARYEQYLNNTLDSEDNSKSSLNFTMARMLKLAQEKGKLSIGCQCVCQKFHAQVLAKVIRERQQPLTALFDFLDKEVEFANKK